MKVAVLGRTRMLALAAQALHERGHEIVAVVSPQGPHHAAENARFRALADGLGCPLLVVADLAAPDVLTALDGADGDVAVSVNWPTLVPRAVRERFAHGVLNAHAGDLPRHRGNATIAWAIVTGEPEIVVAIHAMDDDLDTGPVYARRACPVTESTYIADVYAFLEDAVPDLFAEVIEGIEHRTLVPEPQSGLPEAGLRCYPRTAEDGWIDWTQAAGAIGRLVRASSEPLDGAYTALGDERLTIWRAHAEPLPHAYLGVPGQVVERRVDSGEVAVLTPSGVLVLERVQAADGPVVPAADLLRSTRLRLGLHVPSRLADLSRRVARLEQRLSREPAP